MTTPEHFDASELDTFFDIESQKELDKLRLESEHAIVEDRVWAAIDSLDMDLAISRDVNTHETHFNTLITEIAEIVDTLPVNTEPRYSKQDHARAIANEIWDEQVMMIEQISIALDMQLHGNIPSAEKMTIKKKIMARLLISDNNQEQWLALTDAVLDGDAIDPNNPEDYEFITEALEITVNLDNSPEIKLYDSILAHLGVPELSEDIPDDYDIEEVEHLVFAARDITEATLTKVQATQQPERHSSIHTILRSYNLTNDIDLQGLLKLVDSYAELKTTQS